MRLRSRGFDPASPEYIGDWRSVPVGANLQPAAAFYVRTPGESQYRAFAIDVLRFEVGKVTDIVAFELDEVLRSALGLPPEL